MSFFDNIKIFGILAIVVGIISIVLGGYGGYSSGSWVTASGAVGGLMLLVLGLLCYLGKFDSKPGVVSGYLMLYGLAFIIIGLMGLWAGIINVIIGLVAIFIGFRMYSGSKNGPIWWYLLVVIFILLILGNLISVFGIGFGSVEAILSAVSTVCLLIVNLYLFLFILDSSVKSKFAF